MWYQMEESRKYWTLKRQKHNSYMRVLYTGKCEHLSTVRLLCNQNPKTSVRSCSKIHRLCKGQAERQVQETQLNTLTKAGWLQKGTEMFRNNKQSSYNTILTEGWLSFIKCVDEHSWEVIITTVIITSLPIGCLGSSCDHGALMLSAVRKSATWLSKEWVCYVCSGAFT